jgi:Protein of unknown function (DUF3570)
MLQVKLTTFLLFCISGIFADQIEYTNYYFRDNKNNKVATPAFSLMKTLWQRTQVMLDIELDQATSPPVLDGVTGASRPQRNKKTEFVRNRGQAIIGLGQGLGDNTKLNASYYFSQEVDYASQSFVLGLTQDLFLKNLTVVLRGQYTMDSVGELLESGAILNRFKETHQGSLVVSQLLSPTTIFRVGADAMRDQGFLSNPYLKNFFDPVTQTSITNPHPNTRYRQALWTEISQYLRGLEASLILSYRYYWDDWSLSSHTLTFKLNKYITQDWIVSPEYRYYDQTGVDFGDYAKGQPNYYRSDDEYKLSPFTSHNSGMSSTFYLRAFSKRLPSWEFLNNTSISLMYFRYFNNALGDNFASNIVETRVKFTF